MQSNFPATAPLQVEMCKFVSKKNLEMGLFKLRGLDDPFAWEAMSSKFMIQ